MRIRTRLFRRSAIAKAGVLPLAMGGLTLPQMSASPFPAWSNAHLPRAENKIAFDPGRSSPVPATPVELVEAASAFALNAAAPAVAGAASPAAPFSIGQIPSSIDRSNATECLAAAIYYEAASETLQGQRAVAQVVLNRMRHPVYPHSVCGVIFQGSDRTTGCQFTFTCDGSLARDPVPALWRKARIVADAALSGYVEKSVGTATHYHTMWVAPEWRLGLSKITTLGAHIFYRWQGGWGRPAAFSARYAGNEPYFGNARASLTTLKALSGMEAKLSDNQAAAAPPELPVAARSALPVPPALRVDASRGNLLADERTGVLLDAPSKSVDRRVAVQLPTNQTVQ